MRIQKEGHRLIFRGRSLRLLTFRPDPRRGDSEKKVAKPAASGKERRRKKSATLTSAIMTGTSTSGPMTAANAAPELMPKTETATAIASSKLFEAAVNERVAVFE